MYTGVSNLSRHYITYLSINFVHFICDSHCIFILVKKNIIFAQCLTYIPTYIYLPLPRYIAKTAWKNDTYTVFVFSKNLKKRTKKKIIKIYVQVPNELYRKIFELFLLFFWRLWSDYACAATWLFYQKIPCTS